MKNSINLIELIENALQHVNSSTLLYSIAAIVVGVLTKKLVEYLFTGKQMLTEPEQELLNDMVIPWRSIKYKRFRSLRGKWHTNVIALKDIPIDATWRPVLVFCNRKSGAGQGAEIIKEAKKLLNPLQVHDLSRKPPRATLELCRLLPDVRFVVVVCGGDGSANWIISAIDDLNLKTFPYVSIIPLGTGNDLSQFLKWGEAFDSEVDSVENYLVDIRDSEEVKIDRWEAAISYRKSYFNWGPSKRVKFTNYFSIGCDALLALGFHKKRQKRPGMFFNRSLNKLFYFGFGAKDVLEQQCQDLHESLELWLDGEKVKLPYLECLLFLNIPNWGGGCVIWDGFNETENINWTNSDPNDGKIEVMGFTSSFHMAQIQINFAQPIRIGQASEITLELKSRAPAQADGEPWEQTPCQIHINCCGDVTMLRRTVTTDSDEAAFLQFET